MTFSAKFTTPMSFIRVSTAKVQRNKNHTCYVLNCRRVMVNDILLYLVL